MADFISVILPTHNPKKEIIDQTINGLKEQTLPFQNWELIIIDNNSSKKLDIYLDWHCNSKIIFESKQGLTYARFSGFSNAKGQIVIMVDDDNVLDKHYLQNCLDIFSNDPNLGAIGGKSKPFFECEPPYWVNSFYGNLALRDLGNIILLEKWEEKYPLCAPIGAGMAIKKKALKSYLGNISSNEMIITDRTASSLSSSGDNDIVIEILKSGWMVGYFPELELTHIIPKERFQLHYFARLVKETNKSWTQLLEKHQINPWNKIPSWTIPFRKAKSWFKTRAWKNKINYLNWKASCGYYEGLSK